MKTPETLGNGDAELFDEEFLRQLETLALTSRKAAAGARRGERRTKKKGSGVEFADHRPYSPGEDIRFLDVSVLQRFGKLLLRVYEEEEDLSLYFLVDCSASMGTAGGKKLRQAKRLAAALGYIGLTGLDRVGIVALSAGGSERMPPTRGRGRIFWLLRFLAKLRAVGQTDLSASLRGFAAQHRRRGLAVLLTDLYDPQGFEAGINVLRFNRFDACVIHLTAEEDLQVPQPGDLRIVDVETLQSRDVTVTSELAKRVAQANADRQAQVQRFCAARGVPYFLVRSETPFDEVVLKILRQGGLLA